MVYVDEVYQFSLARGRSPFSEFTVTCGKSACMFSLLVEAMGHINYGVMQKTDRKGLISLTQLDPSTK